MKVICKKCKGEGIIPDKAEYIFTFGIAWIFDKLTNDRYGWVKCPRCKGNGFLKF